jgi:hypothetical protein
LDSLQIKMEKKDNNLAKLFQQLGKKSETLTPPDLKLKDEVFTTLDSASLVADMIDLFTLKFVLAQAEVLDSIPESEYGVNEKQKLFKYLEKKYKENKENTEGGKIS